MDTDPIMTISMVITMVIKSSKHLLAQEKLHKQKKHAMKTTALATNKNNGTRKEEEKQ